LVPCATLTKVALIGPLNVPLKIAPRLAEVDVPPFARAATAGFPVAEPRLETSLAKNAPTKLAVSENTSSILLAEPLLAQPAAGIATASRPTQTARLILPP